MVDGPGPVKVYLDPFLRRLNEQASLEWSDLYGKFWFNHPDLG